MFDAERALDALDLSGVVVDDEHVAGEDAMLFERVGAEVFADDAQPAAAGFARAQFVGDDLKRQEAFHARHQLHVVDRLGEEFFGACLQPAHAAVAIVERCENDDGDVTRLRRRFLRRRHAS
jgi:hypothetical protein